MCVVAVGTVCGVGRRVSGLLGLEGPCLRAVKSGLVVVVSRVCGDTVCARVCMFVLEVLLCKVGGKHRIA